MAVLKIYYEKTAGMDYLYKITVEIDDKKSAELTATRFGCGI